MSKLHTLVLALPRAGSEAAEYRRYLREFRSEVRVPCFAVGSVALPETARSAARPESGALHYMPLELLHGSPFDSVSLFGVFERTGAPLSETVRPVFEYRPFHLASGCLLDVLCAYLCVVGGACPLCMCCSLWCG